MEWFHSYVIQTGFQSDILVATSIPNVGAWIWQCCLFNQITGKDVVCCSAMIASYAIHGYGPKAIDLFDQMVDEGARPNHVTFTCSLSACSHSGLLGERKKYFDPMKVYGIVQELKHYACMVDLFSRAGKLSEAENLRVCLKKYSSIWGSLLGACRIYGNLDLAERFADPIFQLDPTHAGYHVLLSNIYAAKSRWSEVERVRALMAGKRTKEISECSWIEFKNQVYKFSVGDGSNPQPEKIYSLLEEFAAPMRQLGYVPVTDFVLHDIEDEAKEQALSYHSEACHSIWHYQHESRNSNTHHKEPSYMWRLS